MRERLVDELGTQLVTALAIVLDPKIRLLVMRDRRGESVVNDLARAANALGELASDVLCQDDTENRERNQSND